MKPIEKSSIQFVEFYYNQLSIKLNFDTNKAEMNNQMPTDLHLIISMAL